VKVPLCLPHSLQHGVRTIEFQTPVYERKILSFAQAVLTQDHWDTADAVDSMLVTAPEPEAFDTLLDENGVLVERVVDFTDFQVDRVRLQAQASHSLSGRPDYCLLMVVAGSLTIDRVNLGPEQAALIPAGWQGQLRSAQPAQGLVFLLAQPIL
jgi:hypothetical protein